MLSSYTHRSCLLAASAIALVVASAPSLHAQPYTAAQHLSFAKNYARDGDLHRAIEHYDNVINLLPPAQTKERNAAYDGLLSLTPRLGRFDRAIMIGKPYAAELHKAGRESRHRAVLKLLGVCYLALGHRGEAREHFAQAIDGSPPDVDPLVSIEAHAYLAQLDEQQKRPDDAQEHWEKVRSRARIALIKPPDSFMAKERAVCVHKLAESLRFLREPEQAIDYLQKLAAEQDRHKDYPELVETLRLLAAHRTALAAQSRDRDTLLLAADHDLRAAIEAYEEQVPTLGPVRQGDLYHELARILQQRGAEGDAAQWREKAARLYRKGLAERDAKHPNRLSADAAFWKLHQLYQQAEMYQRALTLVNEKLEPKPRGKSNLEHSRLHAEQGVLDVYRGAMRTAWQPLQQAEVALAKQQVTNLIDLPRVLISRAIVELNSASMRDQDRDHLDGATKLAQQVRALYKQHGLPGDLVLAETANILGSCHTWRGDYRKAIAEFQAGIEQCDTIGSGASRQRCNLWLNIAVLHRAQNELHEARAACAKALDDYLGFAGKNAKKQLGYACFLGALASMDATMHASPEANAPPGQAQALARFEQVADEARALGALCAAHRIKDGPLMRIHLHCLALARLAHKDFAAAGKLWRQLAKLQTDAVVTLDERRFDPQLPRTLNWLGLAAELAGKDDEAAKTYREALRVQQGARAHPATQHTTLRHLAGLLDRRGEHAESRKLLEQAIEVIESVRGGNAQPFDRAAEQLVAQCIRDRQMADALVFSARSRSHNLCDQLQLRGLDHGVDRLRGEEEALRRLISRTRVGAPLLMTDADGTAIDRALAELDAAQKRYAALERAIYAESRIYGSLAVDANLTETLHKYVVRPGRVVLVYHIGRERSYLLLLGDRLKQPEAWPLMAPARLLEAVQRGGPIVAPVTGANGAPASLLNNRMLRQLVAHHLDQIGHADFTTRGLRLSWDSAVAAPGEVLEQITETVLPRAVRVRIGQLGARQLIVVPDAALHRLPLESLVAQAGSAPRYLLDELPPIVYAPAVSILAHLAKDRPPRLASSNLSLLTMCDPITPQANSATSMKVRLPILGVAATGALASPQGAGPTLAAASLLRDVAFHPGRTLLFRGERSLLPFGTAEESQRVRAHFDPAQVTVLEGKSATEKALRGAVHGKQIVHLAVHGRGAVGELLMTPPDTADGADDGILTLEEVHRLPLAECDLVVLSGCETQYGPQPPLEAGRTLGGAFLMAGARHVIASHWSVEDRSTAELMGRFFDEAMATGGNRLSYAQALQNARKKLRGSAQWSAPVYWAPFVLISTGDVLDSEPLAVEPTDPVAEVVAEPPPWYTASWVMPAAIAIGAAVVMLVKRAVMSRRRRDEYRMPGV